MYKRQGLTREQVDADEGGWPRWGVLGIACVVALSVGVFLAVSRDTGGTDSLVGDPSPDLVDGTVPPGHPSLDDSDQFEELTLAQLETEVADESAPVALRLTLAEQMCIRDSPSSPGASSTIRSRSVRHMPSAGDQ